jgi:phosphoglycolate phosphatase
MIVFDLDGTLVDSRPEIVRAMRQAWHAEMGAEPFPDERLRIGPPLMATLAALAPSLDARALEGLASAFRASYDASDFSATLPYPGIVDALDALRSRGEMLAIATNKRRTPTRAIVARWFPDRFERIACVDGCVPDDGAAPGTKASMLEWLIRGAPGETVMVGDSVADIRAARSVGVASIAVTWGYEDATELAAARPDHLVREVSSLLAVVSALEDARLDPKRDSRQSPRST